MIFSVGSDSKRGKNGKNRRTPEVYERALDSKRLDIVVEKKMVISSESSGKVTEEGRFVRAFCTKVVKSYTT